MAPWSHSGAMCRKSRDRSHVRPSPGPPGRDNGPVNGFPLLLDLTGRRVVVVGGGFVASRRARGLHEAGAHVVVVAREVAEEIAELGVETVTRPFEDGDVDDAWLVMACTDDPAVNADVAAAAERRRIFCVR